MVIKMHAPPPSPPFSLVIFPGEPCVLLSKIWGLLLLGCRPRIVLESLQLGPLFGPGFLAYHRRPAVYLSKVTMLKQHNKEIVPSRKTRGSEKKTSGKKISVSFCFFVLRRKRKGVVEI